MIDDKIPADPDQPLEACARLLPSDPAAAAGQLREFVAANPLSAEAYRLLARANRAAAESSPASGAIHSSVVSGAQLRLQHAARALQADDLEPAEIILRQRLLQAPADVEALRLMALLAIQLDYRTEAEQLLQLALEIEPGFAAAAVDLAKELYEQNRPLEVLAITGELLRRDPGNEAATALQAAALGRAGRFEESLRHYEELIRRSPRQAALWTNYGHILKTMGRSNDGLRAMRTVWVGS